MIQVLGEENPGLSFLRGRYDQCVIPRKTVLGPDPKRLEIQADRGMDREQWAKEIAQNKKRQARKEAKEKKRAVQSSG